MLRFFSNSIVLGHPQKLASGGLGDDAVFETDYCVGALDGVGGWASQGVDPGAYSRQLAGLARNVALDGSEDRERMLEVGGMVPGDVCALAYNKTNVLGSSTFVAAGAGRGHVNLYNLGDSGGMLLRLGHDNTTAGERHQAKWGVVYATEPQVQGFNTPLQLGPYSDNLPSHGDTEQLAAYPGDLLLLFTDGVSDNMFEEDILNELHRVDYEPCLALAEGINGYIRALHEAARKADDPSHLTLSLRPEVDPTRGLAEIARAANGTLATLAARIATRSQAIGANPNARTPFQAAAERNAMLYKGGKLDDSSVVAALVVRDAPGLAVLGRDVGLRAQAVEESDK